jgi:Tfp pilus assembly protein PilF
MVKKLRKITAEEFARRLKATTQEKDKRFATFLGAGCSVSSGIPAAGELVQKQWLPRLRELCEPAFLDLETWAKKEFPSYNTKHPSALYGKVMERLFLSPDDRQREIEKLCDGKFPGFGYAVLSSLVALEGGQLNVILTTNFDDLMADALYLFSNARPLVILHETLARYIRLTRTSPLIIKLHGDNRLSPQNTVGETKALKEDIDKQVRLVLSDRGLIFIGYGGNDNSVTKMLETIPIDDLPLGVFWVSGSEPLGAIRPWLETRDAIWVEKGDFDELMLLIRDTFDLPHPDQARFDEVFEKYKGTYDSLSARIVSLPNTAADASAMKGAIERADKSFPDMWAIVVRANRLRKTNPDKANALYTKGLTQFPSSSLLMGYYANFLSMENNYDKAEEYYKKALKTNPRNAITLTHYAIFLTDVRKDYNNANKYFKKALELDPKKVSSLGNYAIFLKIQRKYDEAEEYFKKAIKANPTDSVVLASYALFLADIRKEPDIAEEHFRKALELHPKNVDVLDVYGTFLEKTRKNYAKAEEYYKKALELDPKDANTLCNYAGLLLSNGKINKGLSILKKVLSIIANSKRMDDLASESWFYAFAHCPPEQRGEALKNLKRVILSGGRSPDWDLTPNIIQAGKDGHPNVKWLEKLAAVISNGADIKTLDDWAEWKAV